MPLSPNQLASITRSKFIPKLADNIFDSNPFLERAKRKGALMLDGGLDIRMPLGYAQTTAAGFFGAGDTFSVADNEQLAVAVYNWKFAYANIMLKEAEILQNSGDSQVISLVKAKTMMSEKTLADILGTALWNTGSNADAVHGLRYLLSASNSPGGISQSTNSWWAAGLDSTSTVVTMYALQAGFNAATIGSQQPTVAYTTRTIYNLYYALLQPQQRFVDTDTAKAGFSSLMFNSIPIIADSHAPSSYLAMINEDFMKLVIHEKDNFQMSDFVRPANQRVKVAQVFFTGNLCSNQNRAHYLFSALAS